MTQKSRAPAIMASSMNVETPYGITTNGSFRTFEIPAKRKVQWGLLLIYTTFMAVGAIGGPLLQRLYYLHGGARKWLSSCLQSIGFPVMFIPLFFLYAKHFSQGKERFVFIRTKLFLSSSFMGILLGLDNYLYSAGLAYIPVSTSSLLFATQLAFTALFAFLIVKQKFTFYSVNCVALMTLGALVLALHTSSDRPPGISNEQYLMGFFFTLGGAALLGFILPSIETCYMKAGQEITFAVVMQFQVVFTFSATVFCLVGMAINKDFEIIPREAREFGLGEVKYYVILVASAIVWQSLYIGTLGVVHCASSLFTGILVAVLLPFTQIAATIAFDEKFNGEKGMSLGLCLWGFTSYFIGEYKKSKKMSPIIEADGSENVV